MRSNKNRLMEYFDRSGVLRISNPRYASSVMDLLEWMRSLDEDSGDTTSNALIKKDQGLSSVVRATITANAPLVVSGLEEIESYINEKTSLKVEMKGCDGAHVQAGTELAHLMGSVHELLACERILLNLVQHMSGISTLTNYLIVQNRLSSHTGNGSAPYLAATRKTPFMWLDKKAVHLGGGLTHRLSLSDGMLVKDNHLLMMRRQLGNKKTNVFGALLRTLSQKNIKQVEIEVDTLDDFDELLVALNDSPTMKTVITMLDNFSVADIRRALGRLEKIQSTLMVKPFIEVSGGVSIQRLHEYLTLPIDVISMGALTHSAPSVDISLHLI